MINRKIKLRGLIVAQVYDRDYTLTYEFIYNGKIIPNVDDHVEHKGVCYNVYGRIFMNQQRFTYILLKKLKNR